MLGQKQSRRVLTSEGNLGDRGVHCVFTPRDTGATCPNIVHGSWSGGVTDGYQTQYTRPSFDRCSPYLELDFPFFSLPFKISRRLIVSRHMSTGQCVEWLYTALFFDQARPLVAPNRNSTIIFRRLSCERKSCHQTIILKMMLTQVHTAHHEPFIDWKWTVTLSVVFV